MVVHQEEFEVGEVVDEEFFVAGGDQVSGLFVGSVTDLGHGQLALEPSSDLGRCQQPAMRGAETQRGERVGSSDGTARSLLVPSAPGILPPLLSFPFKHFDQTAIQLDC